MGRSVKVDDQSIKDLVDLVYASTAQSIAQELRERKILDELTPQERTTVTNVLRAISKEYAQIGENTRKGIPENTIAPMLLAMAGSIHRRV